MVRAETNKKRQIAVQEYCSNGFNWLQALLTAGYSESYAKHSGYKLLDNTGIQKAIDANLADRQRKTGFNREKAESMLRAAYALAKSQNNSQAMTGAVRELNALYGLRQESKQQQGQSLTINIAEEAENSPETAQDGRTHPKGSYEAIGPQNEVQGL